MILDGISAPVLVGFFVLLIVWTVRYMKSTYSVLEHLDLPGPKPIWVFGSALDFKDKSPLDVFKEWKIKFGKVYGFFEGFRACIVINDPEFSKLILSKHFDKFSIRPQYVPFAYFPVDLSLVTSSRETWKKQRPLISKTLNYTSTLQQVVLKVQKSTDKLVHSMEKQIRIAPDGFDIYELLHKYVVDTSAAVLFGIDVDYAADEVTELLKYTKAFQKSASADNELTGLARLFPALTPLLQMFDTEHRNHHMKAEAIIKRRLQVLRSNTENNNSNLNDNHSVIAHVMAATNSRRLADGTFEKSPLSDEEIIVNALQLFGETFQTTLSSISFILYELAMNEDLQQRVYEEICHVCGTEKENLDWSAMQSLKYFEQFFSETLRLHPVAPGIQRTCSEDCTINDVTFRKGMVVRLMTCTLYDDENIYPEPHVFNPDRFSTEERLKRHAYSFLPFGQGPRSCPGIKLATMEIKVTVSRILQKYRLQRSKETEVPMKTALRPSLCPANGVNIKFVSRSQ